MNEDEIFELGRDSSLIHFHFDVSSHFLTLDTFIETAQSARNIVDSFNKELFDQELEYEFVILPPEEGSFLSRMAIWVSGGVLSVSTFLDTEIGSSYFEGLTGETPGHYSKELGKAQRRLFDEVIESGEDKIAAETECKIAADVISAMAQGVLEIDRERLQSTGLGQLLPKQALEGRTAFYEACLKNKAIKALGFEPEDDFPIERKRFPERAANPARIEEEPEIDPWAVSTETIYVTSPNWDREDQFLRQWKGKDSIRRDCWFTIDDGYFWSLVKSKELHVDVLDQLKVQWAYQMAKGRPKNRRVLRVLEFNGNKLASSLSEDDIYAILGDFEQPTIKQQSGLFE